MATRFYLHQQLRDPAAQPGTYPSAEQSTTTTTAGSPAWALRTMTGVVTNGGPSHHSITATTQASTAVQRYLMASFTSVPLMGAGTLNADTWTFNAADSQSNLAANFAVNGLNLYVWRPSAGAKVGTIKDFGGTAIGGLEAAAINTAQVTTYTFASTAVGYQDGDVVICEVWASFQQATAAAYTVGFYYDGATLTPSENVTVFTLAAYLETPQNVVFQNQVAGIHQRPHAGLPIGAMPRPGEFLPGRGARSAVFAAPLDDTMAGLLAFNAEYGAMSVDRPIALFPVRLETKFVSDPDRLAIRVYPDEIVADTHERLLTAEEVQAGKDYWSAAWPDTANGERAQWPMIVRLHGPERAAYIVREMEPGNLAARPSDAPIFPSPAERSAVWTRPVEARVLPDRWIAVAYRDGRPVKTAFSKLVPDPLALSFDPAASAATTPFDGLDLDDALHWAVDFNAAIESGMGMVMPLTADEAVNGFERLIVFGVKHTLSAADGATRLASLLESHHYSRGLAFVRQGTPTNNSDASPSGYPPSTAPDVSFAIERGAALDEPGGAGARAEVALGLVPTSEVFAHVEGSSSREAEHARVMNRALWPCTLGYYLEQLFIDETLPHAQRANLVKGVREYFEQSVIARGPLPAFRVSTVPYGLLPVSSVERWVPAPGAGQVERKLPVLLKAWRKIWLEAARSGPHVGRVTVPPTAPDQELLQILGIDASAREVRVRETLGRAYIRTVFKLLGWDLVTYEGARVAPRQTLLELTALVGENPRVLGMVWADVARRFRHALVAPALSESEMLQSPNYIASIRDASILDLSVTALPGRPERSNPLLYHLLRQGALVEYNRLIVDTGIAAAVLVDVEAREVELFHVLSSGRLEPNPKNRDSVWERMNRPFPTITGDPTKAIGVWLLESGAASAQQAAASYRAALDALAVLPTAELERLMTETLDACSHRIDPWITSLATRRLEDMRGLAPTGVYLGGYGFVEKLKPRPPATATAGGFIHTPSMSHAAAAAVLRNAHLSRTGAERDSVTVDLSSRRVRRALSMLEGVQNGQPLGALLGYRFERDLHDAMLDQYIDDFRRGFPLGADPSIPPPASAAETIAARNVVDGLALRKRWVETPGTYPWGVTGLPPVATVTPFLNKLDDDVDATSDLLLAESVYQAVQGNPDRTGGALAALAAGNAVPRPRVVEAPLGGTRFTQRLMVMLGAPARGPSEGWSGSTPRSVAEPRLNDWARKLLGDPATVECLAEWTGPTPGNVTITLDLLGLEALDVVDIARRNATDELVRRIEQLIHTSQTTFPTGLTVDFTPTSVDRATTRVFQDVLETARVQAEVIAASRPLSAADLLRPGSAEEPAPFDEAELSSRAAVAWEELKLRRDNLHAAIAIAIAEPDPTEFKLNDVRAALWALTFFGIPTAVPLSLTGAEGAAELLSQAEAVKGEATSRLDAAAADPSPSPPPPAVPRLQTIFGPTFLPLPQFHAGNGVALDAAIANGDTWGTIPPLRWMHRIGRVRKAVGHFKRMAMSSEAIRLGSAPIELRAAQLPNGANLAWVAGETGAQQPANGMLSLTMLRELTFPDLADPEAMIAGLLVDEWPELIPSPDVETAFAVHYDNPGAEAPQAVLLAIPPDLSAAGWDPAMVLAIVEETLELAKIRSVDAALLGGLGMLIPTIYCAGDVQNNTVSNDLLTLTVAEDTLIA